MPAQRTDPANRPTEPTRWADSARRPGGTSQYGAWVSATPADPPPASDAPRCSAKDCRADATTDLTWRNPRLHDAARMKHWLACPDHADDLAGFLTRRGFLLDRGPLTHPDPLTGHG